MCDAELAYTAPVVAFDLDDTLYPELDFLKSGYRAVTTDTLPLIDKGFSPTPDHLKEAMMSKYNAGLNPFDWLATQVKPLPEGFINGCVHTYRFHTPDISPFPGVRELFTRLTTEGIRIVIITDGRARTQRNKLSALGLLQFIAPANILISEETGADKTTIIPWQIVVRRYPNASRFVYVGDNPAKDFLIPRTLGWLTVGLRDMGYNIHPQLAETPKHEPQIWLQDITELSDFLFSNII